MNIVSLFFLVKHHSFISLATALVITGAELFGYYPLAAQVPAESADQVVERFGVNTHFNYNDTHYVQEFPTVLAKLSALGVRYIRDGAIADSAHAGRLSQAFTAHGIRTLMVTAGWTTDITDLSRIDDLLDDAKYTLGAEKVVGFEGVNEPDHEAAVFAADYPTLTQDWTQALYEKVRADSTWNNVSVVGPTCAFGDCYDSLGDLSVWVDQGALHWYPGNLHPEHTDFNFFQWHLDQSRLNNYPNDEPLWVTETGSNTSEFGISESLVAKYLPRHLMWMLFEKKVARFFEYELLDLFNDKTDVESNWGLLRNDASEKPAYQALKNLFTLLEDEGSSFIPDSLDYELTGDKTDVFEMLLQQADGTFYLVVWQGVEASDSLPDRPLTLTLHQPVAEASLYLPSDPEALDQGTQPVDSYQDPTSISLKVPDHLLVVKLTPALEAPLEISRKADEASWSVYPNPATEVLTVESADSGQVVVYDLNRRPVMRHEHQAGASHLNVAALRRGLYLVKFRDAQGRETYRRTIIQ